ncbi:MAG: signal peptidase II [Bacteroidetes bacterium]|nr:signal peptidase II [Bacteroidota bacterium]
MSELRQNPSEVFSEKGALKRFFFNYRFFWWAFFVVLIDQVVKIVVKFTMIPYEEIRIAGDFVRINYIENKGAAFGLTISDLFQKVGVSIDDETAKLALTLFSIFAVIVIIYLLQTVRNSRTSLPYFLAFILGGAIGNIIDRVFYGVWFAGINDYEGGLLHGRVVDMFYVNLVHGEVMGLEMNLLPVFNVADAAITVGIVAIIIFQRRFFKASATEAASTEEDTIAAAASEAATAPEQAP